MMYLLCHALQFALKAISGRQRDTSGGRNGIRETPADVYGAAQRTRRTAQGLPRGCAASLVRGAQARAAVACVLVLLSALVVGPVGAQAQGGCGAATERIPFWASSYGGQTWEEARSIEETSDGGYVAIGYTTSFGAGYEDIWVLKLDGKGGVQWQKTYGGQKDDRPYSIEQTTGGGYVLTGRTDSFGEGEDDIWVLKLDGAGWVQWQKTYGGPSSDRAYSIEQTAGGGYVLTGCTTSFGAGASDIWVLKLDGAGWVQWQKTYGGQWNDEAHSLQQTIDGGYVLTGYTYSFGAGTADVWVLKLDGAGRIRWQKTYGGQADDAAYTIRQTSDGGYVLVGATHSFGGDAADSWVLKLDGEGGVQWQKTFGGESWDEAQSIEQTADGGYVLAGYTYSFGAGYRDVWVLKLDGEGAIQWQKTYGGPSSDRAYL